MLTILIILISPSECRAPTGGPDLRTRHYSNSNSNSHSNSNGNNNNNNND